jgi:hypothetical protein
MNHHHGPRLYRVRTVKRCEQAVPDEVEGTRFASLESANRYASSLLHHHELRVMVEKLAPGGSWLSLSSHS